MSDLAAPTASPPTAPEEIVDGLFRLCIPLPGTPLKTLNAYVVKSAKRHLVVDVGLNLDVCRAALIAGLDAIGAALDAADFFITHMHADHLGLLPELAGRSTTVYFNAPEARLMRLWKGPADLIRFSVAHGFPRDVMEQAFEAHPAARLRPERFPVPLLVADGDIIAAGPYGLRCVHTPGHTPGHTCLYDPAKKVLIAGDHLLGDITPNVVCWSDGENPLGDYLESLDKVAELDVEMVLPGHRGVFHDHRRRVAELHDHHERRLREVRTIISAGTMTAFEVAAKMTWEFEKGDWDAFPVTQKWFATGEALAHLRYLEQVGTVQRETADGIVRFHHALGGA